MGKFNERDHSRTCGPSGEKRKKLESFVAHRLELLQSPAWKHRPRPLKEILERLEIEHLRHGGQQNGELYVSYVQFEKDCELVKRRIRPALEAGVELGLISIAEKVDGHRGNLREPNAYGLLYLPLKSQVNALDSWRDVKADQAQAALDRFKNSDVGRAKYQQEKTARSAA